MRLPVGKRKDVYDAIRELQPAWYAENRHCRRCGAEFSDAKRISALYCNEAHRKQAERRRSVGLAEHDPAGRRGVPLDGDPGAAIASAHALAEHNAYLDRLELVAAYVWEKKTTSVELRGAVEVSNWREETAPSRVLTSG